MHEVIEGFDPVFSLGKLIFSIRRFPMKAGVLLTGTGALVYLTSHKSHIDDALIDKFKSKGINKFIAYEVPVDKARERYAAHYDMVTRDLKETDDLRILDYDGSRALKTFSFKELGQPFMYE